MTVAGLIELLKTQDPNRLVILSSDGDGNSYSPLDGCSTVAYRADTTWSGETGLETLTKEDIARGFTEEDLIEDGVPALILHPIN